MTMWLNEVLVNQQRLPKHLGDVGIRNLSDFSLLSFLSSCIGAMPYWTYHTKYTRWQFGYELLD